jgi:DNA polymerase-3 subunit delta'
MASLFDDDDIGDDDDIDGVIEAVDDAAPVQQIEYTPRTTPHLFGHEEVETALLKNFLENRLPHAIILSGASGIGKATLAFRLARFLLSQTDAPPTASLFGDAAPPDSLYIAPETPVFRRIVSSGHGDLLTIEREFDEKRGQYKKDISVDAVRKIPHFLRKTAAEGGWRVVIVDSAEYLNRNSQNALLKILEEPPKKAILILTTSQVGGFLPTIRSRCRILPMKSLSDKNMGALIDTNIQGLRTDEKNTLIRLAEGSIGKALEFYKQDGITLYKQLLEIVTTLPDLDMITVHSLAEKLCEKGAEERYATAADIITGWCEQIARAGARGQKIADVIAGDGQSFEKIISRYPPRHFLDSWEKISQLIQQTEQYNLDKKLAIIGTFLTLQNPQFQGYAL